MKFERLERRWYIGLVGNESQPHFQFVLGVARPEGRVLLHPLRESK